MKRATARARGWRVALVATLAGGLAGAAAQTPAPAPVQMPASAPVQTPAPAPVQLRVVGGLGALNQFVRHEVPFWTRDLTRLSGGRYSAEIVPFDRAGIRGQDLLSMVRLGTVPFGTLLVSQASPRDAELSAPDLAGLNPDADALRHSVAAYRPRLQALLRERHNAELLALYIYPSQVLFCNVALTSLADLKGRRVRTSSASQADLVTSLGGKPVRTPFAEIIANLRAGNLDCAITGTMSGNTIGLHEQTSHLHTLSINWGLSLFVAHGPTWRALPADLRQLLSAELPRLEAAIWDESIRESDDGIACNSGDVRCRGGRPGRMTVVRPTRADDMLRLDILRRSVLPQWLQRCGPGCDASWNQLLAPVTGVHAPAR